MTLKAGSKSLVVVGLLLISGCSMFQAPSSPPEVQVCPTPPVCPVCKPAFCQVLEKVVVSPTPTPIPSQQTGGELDLPIVGGVESVVVEPPSFKYEARIDTGAESSSIHAENIQLIERDGKRYVRFSLLNPETSELVELERRLRRKVLIKQQQRERERRYVVKLWLTLGGIRELVDVTLSNRADFEYPVLVGRNLLTDTAIVDVSRQHILK
ncbi:MAG: RimK/LysX family protein [Porticoccus sp.]|nr:ATP-dependent zinc protease [Porticoccus sp.]MDX2349676.1 RimK/LysX family protein [Porticoccus sp.]